MTVVVTGAAGFIGRQVVHALAARGHAVTGVDRRPWTPDAGERVLCCDLLDPAADRVLARADAVVHLAGLPGVRDAGRDVAVRRHRDNVVAGQRVLSLTPKDVRVVVASSSSVYGGAGSPSAPRACRESDPPRPLGGYARSKARLEERCRRRADVGGRVTILRPFTVAGEGQRPDMALARWIAAGRAGTSATVIGSLDRRRDVTDVRDVARAAVAVLERDVDGTVNVGTGRTVTLRALLTAVEHALGRHIPVEVVPAATEEPATTCADTTRCGALLGFVPTTDLHAVVGRQLAASRPTLARTA